MKTSIKYTDYYPPSKLRTLHSLLELYKSNNDIKDEARDKLFGSRVALAKELGAYQLVKSNDQTLANKICRLVRDVANKSDEYLEELWFERKEYVQLWWSFVYFLNGYPLRPQKEGLPEIMLNNINPEELLLRIDKQVIPAVKIMLDIVHCKDDSYIKKFFIDAIKPEETLKNNSKYMIRDEKANVKVDDKDINQLLDLWGNDGSKPFYYLALAICIVKKLKIVRKNGIDVKEVLDKMEEVELLDAIVDYENDQKKQVRGQFEQELPNIKTTWHACAMLASIIYTQQN